MFVPLLLGAAVSGAATVGALVQHYRQEFGPMTLAEARALASMPETAIGTATEGLVKLVGVLGCDLPVRSLYDSTLSAVREVHHYRVEGSGIRAVRHRSKVERSEEPFWVDDGTGRVSLDPGACRIDFEREGADIDLVLTDLVMPGIDGIALASRLQRQPPVKVLFMSGYSEHAAMRKTAMSSIIYEVLDMGTGITDAETRDHVARFVGFGGVVAMGCTVGQGITGFSTLALGSIVTFLAIVAGAAAMLKFQYWRLMREA